MATYKNARHKGHLQYCRYHIEHQGTQHKIDAPGKEQHRTLATILDVALCYVGEENSR